MTRPAGKTRRSLASSDRLALLVVSAFMLIDGFDVIVSALLASSIASEWRPPLFLLGVTLGAAQFGSICGAAVSGLLDRRFESKRILVVIGILLGLGSLICAFAPGLTVMVIGRVITGLGLGVATPIVVGYVTRNVSQELRGGAVGMVLANFILGQLLASLTVPWMVGAIGWRGVFVFAAVASAIQLPFLLTLAERARANLAEMPSGTGAKKGRTLIDQNLRAPLLWIVLAAMSTTWVAFLLANWLPFLIERDGLSRALAAGSITGLVAGTAVGSFLLGKLIDRHPSPFKLVAAAILCAVPLLLLLSATALPAAGLLVVSALIGSSVVAASLTTMTLVGKVFPERSRVSAAGWLVVSTKLAGLVAPALGGAMLAMGANMSQIFLVAALASVLGAVSLLFGRSAFRAGAEPAPESP